MDCRAAETPVEGDTPDVLREIQTQSALEMDRRGIKAIPVEFGAGFPERQDDDIACRSHPQCQGFRRAT